MPSNEGESNRLSKAFFQFNSIKKYASIGTTGELYIGEHSVEEVFSYRSSGMAYYGISPTVHSTLHFPFSRFLLGVQLTAGLFIEGGEYQEFLRAANRADSIDVYFDSPNMLGSIGAIGVWKFSESGFLSAQYKSGIPGMMDATILVGLGRNSFWISMLPYYDPNDFPFHKMNAGIGYARKF